MKLTDPDFLANPHATLARLRSHGPMTKIKIPLLGEMWFTTDDATTRAVLKDTDLFRRDTMAITGKSMVQNFWWAPKSIEPLMQNLVIRDDPDHARLRGLVDSVFARHSIEDLIPQITKIADDLLDEIAPNTPIDIVKSYTREVPFRVICHILGMSQKTTHKITKHIKPISSAAGIPSMLWAIVRLKPALAILRKEIKDARISGQSGVIGDLSRAQAQGTEISDDEIVAMIFTLFVAGHETTVHLINNAIIAATDHPEMRGLRGGELDLAIEECMRYYSPVMMTKTHFVARDTDWNGVPLCKGDKVTAFLIAANSDPKRHDTPEEFRLDRRPNAHVGFGFGPHVCLGMQLARAEAHVTLERLFERFPNYDVIRGAKSPAPLKRLGLRGPKRLWLTLN